MRRQTIGRAIRNRDDGIQHDKIESRSRNLLQLTTFFQRRQRRTGASLIELVTAIAMITVILSLTGMTLHRLLRVEQVTSQSFVTERSISRLAIQFREDVHRSQSGTLSPSTDHQSTELSLINNIGERIRYVVSARGVTRLVQEGNKTISREDYTLPECRISLSEGSESMSAMRSVIIERPSAIATSSPSAPKPLRALKIHAVLNQQSSELGVSSEPDHADANRPEVEGQP